MQYYGFVSQCTFFGVLGETLNASRKILQDVTLATEYPFKQIMFVYDQDESKDVSGSSMFQMIPVFTHHSENEMDIYVSMAKEECKLFAKLVYPVGLYNPGKVSLLLQSWGVLQTLLDDPQMDETVVLFCGNLSTVKMTTELSFSAALIGRTKPKSDLYRPPKVAILFPFSALAMATAMIAVKCGSSFHFSVHWQARQRLKSSHLTWQSVA